LLADFERTGTIVRFQTGHTITAVFVTEVAIAAATGAVGVCGTTGETTAAIFTNLVAAGAIGCRNTGLCTGGTDFFAAGGSTFLAFGAIGGSFALFAGVGTGAFAATIGAGLTIQTVRLLATGGFTLCSITGSFAGSGFAAIGFTTFLPNLTILSSVLAGTGFGGGTGHQQTKKSKHTTKQNHS
jgi:hypothetical protein